MSLNAPIFGCVIAGRPLITDFNVVDATKCIAIIEAPWFINDITLFVFPNAIATIPFGYGVALYYSVPPYGTWSIIGCIQVDKPSAVFHTG